MGYKKILTRASIVFVVFLLLLTFFSQTLADLNTPRATAVFIGPGMVGRMHPAVVPASAVRQEAGMEFILYVEAVPGWFSNQYILRRQGVVVEQRDFMNAAIRADFGDLPTGPVITGSDVPVGIGARVRLVGFDALR